MREDTPDVVRAEAGSQNGEAWVGGLGGDRVVEFTTVAEEDADDVEEERDARKRCPILGGSGVLGRFGRLRRWVHGGVTNV